jgi:hypothetical protein
MRIVMSPYRRFAGRGALMLLCLALLTEGVVGQSRSSEKPITNDDVVAMVKAGLSEAVIIAAIKKSSRDFQTGPGALISLKQAGVSESIIQVMVESVQLGPGTGPTSPDTGSLPTAYGYYILGDGLVELRSITVVTKFGLTLADRGFAVDGLPDQETLKITNRTPTVIVYQQNVNINSLRLSSMSFVKSLKAYQFNIINTAPQFFSGVYRKDPNEIIPINLWQPSRNMEMRVEPVAGKPDMYRLTPSMPLEAGRYALYLPDSLHDGDTVFSASQGREATAFEFEIGGSQAPSTSTAAQPYLLIVNESRQDAEIWVDDKGPLKVPAKNASTTRQFELGSTHTLKVMFGSRTNTKQFTVESPGTQIAISETRVRVLDRRPYKVP